MPPMKADKMKRAGKTANTKSKAVAAAASVKSCFFAAFKVVETKRLLYANQLCGGIFERQESLVGI